MNIVLNFVLPKKIGKIGFNSTAWQCYNIHEIQLPPKIEFFVAKLFFTMRNIYINI